MITTCDVYKILIEHSTFFMSTPQLFLDNLTVVNLLIDKGKLNYKLLPPQMKKCHDITLRCAEKCVVYYADLPDEFKTDREILREIIKNNPQEVQYFTKDKELMEIAAENATAYIPCIYDSGDMELRAKMYLSCWYKNDRYVGKIVVNKDEALRYINMKIELDDCLDEKLCTDDDIVRACINNNLLRNFRKVPHKYRSKYKVAISAIQQNSENFYSVDQTLLNDRTFLLEFIEMYPMHHELLPEQFIKNREFIKYFAIYVDKLPEDLCDDLDFAREVVKINGNALAKFSEKIKANREIALIATQDSAFNYYILPKHLREDKQILDNYLVRNKADDLPRELLTDRSFVDYLINNHKFNLIQFNLVGDEDHVLRFLKNNYTIWATLPLEMCRNIEIVKRIITYNNSFDGVLFSEKELIEIVKYNIWAIFKNEQCARLQNNSDIIAYYHKIPIAISPWFSIDRAIACAQNSTLCEIIF